ncbi:GvpL/GvpF family gas vesicle protein [Goodfellowiella coeruleoviolacea]|uniref:Gas vesicle synthesis protein GvpL/GvpF n=1 Tax=Goodfellowiella coeruleoviolacea TaxID=334858 RepID=A0AAE3KIJ6_9PSEU|nr:GvpL/GvpF family gas vesicle protein [Goodfellowiella coeruleoviolacea]MCP2168052.1 Gas vesicle synthesis protein GvpL/GvpF [Goodfellowiella coeruleoviolacea]
MSTYVYAIVGSDHPLRLTGRTGVGATPGELRVIRQDGLAAVVSDAPVDLRAKRRDLLAHEGVLESLTDDGAVLPLRFGTVARDDNEVRTALRDRADQFGELLGELTGRVEVNLKVAHHEDAVLLELLAENAELRELNEATRSAGGGSYEQRLRLGELATQAVTERQRRDGEQVRHHLRPLARRESIGPRVEGYFLNVSYLVDRDQLPAFSSAVAELAKQHGAVMDFRLHGPLPAYSFASAEPARATAPAR